MLYLMEKMSHFSILNNNYISPPRGGEAEGRGGGRNTSILMLLFLAFTFLSADYQKHNTLNLTANYFTADRLGNFYVVTNANTVAKYNALNNPIYIASIKKYGPISYIDVNNPLKILLFFEEFSTVVTLDNTLSETGAYVLPDEGILRAGAVAISFDNNIWVYDELAFKLKKINEQLKIIQESVNLSTFLGADLQPNFMLERDKWVYLNDPKLGILVFDVFGTYKNTIPIKGLSDFQIMGDNLVYIDEYKKIQVYNLKTLDIKNMDVPLPQTAKQVRVGKDVMYILDGKALDLYILK